MIEKLKDLDLSGSGEVLPTPANMTKIFNKVNEIIDYLDKTDSLLTKIKEQETEIEQLKADVDHYARQIP